MAVFGLYFTKNMLRIMKWPRTQGLLKKEYIDSFIFDQTIDQMVDWAASIGAGKPQLALHILAYILKDVDWDSSDKPQLKILSDELNAKYKQQGLKLDELAPHDVIQPVHLSKALGPSIKPEALLNKDLQNRLEQDFIEGLIYGLGNSKSYEAWYTHKLEEFEMNKAIYQKMDIGVDRLPTLAETYRDSEEIIQNYEKEMEIKLPDVPRKLFEEIRAIRSN